MPDLISVLVARLELPRPVTEQVCKHLGSVHGVSRDGIDAFLRDALGGLEDYEVDLIFSPLFTPTLEDQAAAAAVLGAEPLAVEAWPGLVRDLAARPTRASLRTGGEGEIVLPLRAVTIERFVQRLRLDGFVSPERWRLMRERVPGPEQSWVTAVARRAVWARPARAGILDRWLRAEPLPGREALQAWLKVVEAYEPADVADLAKRIPRWVDAVRAEVNAGGGRRPFFNERVEELHGGGRDQRRQDTDRTAARQRELEHLEALARVLAEDGAITAG